MRLSRRRTRLKLAQISRALVVLVVLCGAATPVMAAGSMPELPNLWASAAALSLALATSGSRPKK
jgi:hypothetical protein